MRRVNESVRQVLSESVGDLKDPRIGFVTITGVETSPDLRHAKVFVCVLGSVKKRDATISGLNSSHGVLQATLATRAADEENPSADLRVRSDRGAGRAALRAHR